MKEYYISRRYTQNAEVDVSDSVVVKASSRKEALEKAKAFEGELSYCDVEVNHYGNVREMHRCTIEEIREPEPPENP